MNSRAAAAADDDNNKKLPLVLKGPFFCGEIRLVDFTDDVKSSCHHQRQRQKVAPGFEGPLCFLESFVLTTTTNSRAAAADNDNNNKKLPLV